MIVLVANVALSPTNTEKGDWCDCLYIQGEFCIYYSKFEFCIPFAYQFQFIGKCSNKVIGQIKTYTDTYNKLVYCAENPQLISAY